MASLQLTGHGLGGAQRHQAGLLDGPAPATEVQGEAGRGGGLAGTGRHQDHHAVDGASSFLAITGFSQLVVLLDAEMLDRSMDATVVLMAFGIIQLAAEIDG